jgi:hypothetical protein
VVYWFSVTNPNTRRQQVKKLTKRQSKLLLLLLASDRGGTAETMAELWSQGKPAGGKLCDLPMAWQYLIEKCSQEAKEQPHHYIRLLEDGLREYFDEHVFAPEIEISAWEHEVLFSQWETWIMGSAPDKMRERGWIRLYPYTRRAEDTLIAYEIPYDIENVPHSENPMEVDDDDE